MARLSWCQSTVNFSRNITLDNSHSGVFSWSGLNAPLITQVNIDQLFCEIPSRLLPDRVLITVDHQVNSPNLLYSRGGIFRDHVLIQFWSLSPFGLKPLCIPAEETLTTMYIVTGESPRRANSLAKSFISHSGISCDHAIRHLGSLSHLFYYIPYIPTVEFFTIKLMYLWSSKLASELKPIYSRSGISWSRIKAPLIS